MPAPLQAFLIVGLGGALGAIARYGLTLATLRDGGSIPLGTFTSNLLGCLVMGAIAQLMAGTQWFNDAGTFPDHYRLLFAVGFCGSFTTLSALVFEMSALMQKEQLLVAFAYLVATLIGGFACFYLGAQAIRMLHTS